MRELTLAELDLIAGGLDDDDEDIVVTGSPYPPSYQPPYESPPPSYSPSPPSYGGGGGSPPPPATPLSNALAHDDQTVVGHHIVYTPKNPDAEQKKADDNMIKSVQDQDAKINSIPDDHYIKITERWTDAEGVQHEKTYTESAADYKATWNSRDFAVMSHSDYGTLNGGSNNDSGRGSSDLGANPNGSGNHVVGFDQDLVMSYHNAANGNTTDQLAAMEYLVAHETSHDTQTGVSSNSDTYDNNHRTDTTADGTSNHANENLANTMALAALKAMGINLGDYAAPNYVRNGWDDSATWQAPPPPPDSYDPGNGGWGDPQYPGVS